MRFFHPATKRLIELRNPRTPFFLFGPFYLLWIRLWQDALVFGFATYGVVRVSLIAATAGTGISSRLDSQAVLNAFYAVMAAADRGVDADLAYRALVAASLPFYLVGFVLMVVMSTATYLLPSYLAWRLQSQGYVKLVTDALELEEDIPALR